MRYFLGLAIAALLAVPAQAQDAGRGKYLASQGDCAGKILKRRGWRTASRDSKQNGGKCRARRRNSGTLRRI